MKQLKALNVLKWLANNEALSGAFHNEAIEAISELKALQSNYEAQESIIADLKKQLKPKSCDGCKHEHTFKSICFMCLRTSPDYYTPKDNQ